MSLEECDRFVVEIIDDLHSKLKLLLATPPAYSASIDALVYMTNKLTRWIELAAWLLGELRRLREFERRYSWRPIAELEGDERDFEFAQNGRYLGRGPWIPGNSFRGPTITHFRECLEPPAAEPSPPATTTEPDPTP